MRPDPSRPGSRRTATPMTTIDQALAKLQSSRFRRNFHLSAAERAYVREHGPEVIRAHARDFVRTRLAPAVIANDGRQTPWRGHPVFVAQHATACCCRECLRKWYKVPPGRELTEAQQKKIVDLLMAWIERELQRE